MHQNQHPHTAQRCPVRSWPSAHIPTACPGPSGRQRSAHPPEAAAWRQVLPRLSGVLISKPADSTCSLLSEETMLYN